MSSSERAPAIVATVEGAAREGLQDAYRRMQEIVTSTEAPDGLSNADVQQLLAVACKEFAVRQQNGNRFGAFGPEQAGTGLTATDAAFVASAVLDALSVEIFELGMWKTWGTT